MTVLPSSTIAVNSLNHMYILVFDTCLLYLLPLYFVTDSYHPFFLSSICYNISLLLGICNEPVQLSCCTNWRNTIWTVQVLDTFQFLQGFFCCFFFFLSLLEIVWKHECSLIKSAVGRIMPPTWALMKQRGGRGGSPDENALSA